MSLFFGFCKKEGLSFNDRDQYDPKCESTELSNRESLRLVSWF